MGGTNTEYIMTLANSIIGVGILAMPFCFEKCGILLSTLLLLLSNFITRLCCHYLVKTSIKTRRKNFEFLGSYIFGSSGKLMVELCIIGYLMGTCITYFVVVGDLGPQIISKVFDINSSDSLRMSVMIIVTVFCIIPLGLLKNIESLSHVSITSIIFYFCLVLKIMFESEERISFTRWYDNIHWWRPSGVMQCLPIFSMALACQMQLFEIYESLPNQSLEKMNQIVKVATNICTGVYILVGVFGYIAFNGQHFSGNILLNFSPSFASDVIKLGFVLSVAFSFPLVIFPCRASLYSLLYHRTHSDASHYIPEHRFRYITILIIVVALIIGIMIPSIELVIGLVGSTIGVAICIMFPASCFVKTNKKNSTEKLTAQFLLVFGFFLMILGTYANLGAIDEQQSSAGIQLEKISSVTIGDTIVNPDKLPKPLTDQKDFISDKLQLDEPLPSIKSFKRKHNKSVLRPLSVQKSKDPVREINLADAAAKGKNEPILPNLPPPEIKPDNVKPAEILSEVKPKEVLKEENVLKVVAPIKAESTINKDAIQKEEQEIAIEAKNDKLDRTKEILEEVKNVLEKQNIENQKIVLEKIHKISEQVNKIEKQQEIDEKLRDAKDKPMAQVEADDEQLKKLLEPPVPLVQLLGDAKLNLSPNAVEKSKDNENIQNHTNQSNNNNQHISQDIPNNANLNVASNNAKNVKDTDNKPIESIGRELLDDKNGAANVKNNSISNVRKKRDTNGTTDPDECDGEAPPIHVQIYNENNATVIEANIPDDPETPDDDIDNESLLELVGIHPATSKLLGNELHSINNTLNSS